MSTPKNNYVRFRRFLISFLLFPVRFPLRVIWAFRFVRGSRAPLRFKYSNSLKLLLWTFVWHKAVLFLVRRQRRERFFQLAAQSQARAEARLSGSSPAVVRPLPRVIAYALWGSQPIYNIGAVRNVQEVKHYFPGWEVHLYHDETVPETTLEQLRHAGPHVSMRRMPRSLGKSGAFWRFLSFESDGVVLSRDLDSRPTERERAMVDLWLASEKKFHTIMDGYVIPDSFIQNGEIALPGAGVLGVRDGYLRGLHRLIEDWPYKEIYHDDELFLGVLFSYFPKRDMYLHSALTRDGQFYLGGRLLERRLITRGRFKGTYDYVGQKYDTEDIPIDRGVPRPLYEEEGRWARGQMSETDKAFLDASSGNRRLRARSENGCE